MIMVRVLTYAVVAGKQDILVHCAVKECAARVIHISPWMGSKVTRLTARVRKPCSNSHLTNATRAFILPTMTTNQGSKRGKLVLIEGLDRAGKSTQCDRLIANLQRSGEQCELLKFPNRETATGKMINEYLTSGVQLSDHSIHLLFSANRWEQADYIRSRLHAGKTVVLDRYIYSGIAFSLAKRTPRMNMQWCKAPDVGLPKPDLTLFLNVSEAKAQERGGYGQERYEKLDFQRKVKDVFMELKNLDGDWVEVDADQSQDFIERKIWQSVQNIVLSDLIKNFV